MTKENANPTVYAVSQKEEKQELSYAATSLLQRLDCKEAHQYDSLFHLQPNLLLTPAERSIQSALASVHETLKNDPTGEDNALGLIHLAGIHTSYPSAQTNLAHPGTTTRDTNVDTRKICFFQPSSSSASKGESSSTSTIKNRDQLTQREVFDIIRNIQDPEHPLTLEQLNVVSHAHVRVVDRHPMLSTLGGRDQQHQQEEKKEVDGNEGKDEEEHSIIEIRFTPTIPHCSMATLIGLCIRVKLLRSVPKRFKVNVRINPGTHASEASINRQLNDKERVIAALENVHLLGVVNKCISNGMKGE